METHTQNTFISVIVPVHNGSQTLGKAIESLVSQDYLKDFYEILVVDNASTDSTKEVVEAWSKKSNGKVRYLYEEKKGLSYARNKGIEEAKGEIVAFTDDDCVADKGWIDAVARTFQQYNADAVLGKIILVTEIPKDVWYPDWFIKQRMAHVDYGDEVKELKGEDLIGANMSFRREVFKKHGLFNEASIFNFNQDTEFSRRITNNDGIKYYAPQAKVFHHYSIDRLKEEKLFQQSFEWGKAAASVEPDDMLGVKSLFYCLCELMKRTVLLVWFYLKGNKQQVFFTKCKLHSYYGRYTELIRNLTMRKNSFTIGFVAEEFFHDDLRGFGGFGKTLKNLCDYYNKSKNGFIAKVLLAQGLPIAETVSIKRYHGSDVLLRPYRNKASDYDQQAYKKLIDKMGIKFFIAIDYYDSYEDYLLASLSTPILIWIRDPRDRGEWEKIATVPLEIKQRGKKNEEELLHYAGWKESSLKKVIALSQKQKRKIIFATNANFLVERAKKTYGLADLNPYFLPNPTPLPGIKAITYAPKPSLLFLGRLDAVKRPWIVFELAKRFSDIDFYIAGNSIYLELMEPILAKYKNIPNLKFLGLVDDKAKTKLLQGCWGLINTSVHEGLPVTFLETFSFGKCVISCQNPDGLTERFGYYTGEILGEGDDAGSLDKFSQKIEQFMANKKEREEKGRLAKEFLEGNYTFPVFESHLKKILEKENILDPISSPGFLHG